MKELLDITNKYVVADPVTALDQTLNHPFVVVEGMDATGRQTFYSYIILLSGSVPIINISDLSPHIPPIYFPSLSERINAKFLIL